MSIDFQRYDEVEHTPLRVYNRAVTLYNLTEDFGKEVGKEYLGIFSNEEVKQITIMVSYIETRGAEAASKFATRDFSETYEETVH